MKNAGLVNKRREMIEELDKYTQIKFSVIEEYKAKLKDGEEFNYEMVSTEDKKTLSAVAKLRAELKSKLSIINYILDGKEINNINQRDIDLLIDRGLI